MVLSTLGLIQEELAPFAVAAIPHYLLPEEKGDFHYWQGKRETSPFIEVN